MSSLNYFSVNLLPSYFRNYDESFSFPAHDLILQPLLLRAEDCYVYGLEGNAELLKQCSRILVPTRNKYKMDLYQDVIKGYEQLWNVQGWGRGSIVIVMEPNQFKGADIFSHCYDPGVWNNIDTGDTPAAIRYCKDATKRNKIALCLSASHGIEYMKIYAPDNMLKELFNYAKQSCLKSESDTLYKLQNERRSLSR